jgi:hypothetical protein
VTPGISLEQLRVRHVSGRTPGTEYLSDAEACKLVLSRPQDTKGTRGPESNDRSNPAKSGTSGTGSCFDVRQRRNLPSRRPSTAGVVHPRECPCLTLVSSAYRANFAHRQP